MAKKNNYQDLLPHLDKSRLPQHIGIIMDGNGRWAKARKRPRLFGHNEGAKALRQVVELGVELELKYITFYAFSTENWNRPPDEIEGLLKLLKERLLKEIPELNEKNILVKIVGSATRLDPDYLAEIHGIAELTKGNSGMVANIAFNYGGRLEIVEALREIARKPELLEKLDEELISEHLWTRGQPDPDLIIRTSGEARLSNFLLWQSAYSEIYFTDTLWPDFGKYELMQALLDYQKRMRRFGGIGE
ncbi:MAG: isoprenyl transferase [Candidatus Cloacimonadaceae bacterium]